RPSNGSRPTACRAKRTRPSTSRSKEAEMDLKLKGRSALVTGGSKGIGFAIAQFLAAEGCKLVLVSRTEADLKSARDKLQKEHDVPVTVYAMNLAERGRPQELAAKCPDLDILVNNAGSTPRGTLLEVDEDRF